MSQHKTLYVFSMRCKRGKSKKKIGKNYACFYVFERREFVADKERVWAMETGFEMRGDLESHVIRTHYFHTIKD